MHNIFDTCLLGGYGGGRGGYGDDFDSGKLLWNVTFKKYEK